jgi:diguanylate cyclase (GGDEF)-like protein
MEFLHEEIVRSARQRQGLGLILMDIDRFKKINDRHGHPAGDRVLAELAKRLKKQSRPYDRVGRLGGDEMMILMPGCGGKDIRRAAERLREAVAARPFAAEGAKIPVTVSLGAATTDGRPRRRCSSTPPIRRCIEPRGRDGT